MRKALLILGVLLFLPMPAKANHEAEIIYEMCARAREKGGPDAVLVICSYIAWLETELAECANIGPPRSGHKIALTPIAANATLQAMPTKTMMVFRHYPAAKVGLLEAMTPLGLEIRQETGLRPENGEILNCAYRTEPFTLPDFGGEVTKVQANRIRLICGQSEFVVIGIVF